MAGSIELAITKTCVMVTTIGAVGAGEGGEVAVARGLGARPPRLHAHSTVRALRAGHSALQHDWKSRGRRLTSTRGGRRGGDAGAAEEVGGGRVAVTEVTLTCGRQCQGAFWCMG